MADIVQEPPRKLSKVLLAAMIAAVGLTLVRWLKPEWLMSLPGLTLIVAVAVLGAVALIVQPVLDLRVRDRPLRSALWPFGVLGFLLYKAFDSDLIPTLAQFLPIWTMFMVYGGLALLRPDIVERGRAAFGMKPQRITWGIKAIRIADLIGGTAMTALAIVSLAHGFGY
jgi:hypothetical protein